MKFQIRELNPVDEEYLACLEIWNASYPDQPPLTLDEIRISDNEGPEGKFEVRFVVTLDQTIIGEGEITEPSWTTVKGRMSYSYALQPDHEALMVHGQSVYGHIEQYVLCRISGRGVTGLLTRAREDKQTRVEWLEAHGYVCKMRMPLSTLDVASFDFEPWQGRVEEVEATGIVFHTLDFLKRHDPDWHTKLLKAWVDIYLDVPSPIEARPKTLEDFNRMLERPSVTPELWLIAVDSTHRDGSPFGPYAGVTFVNRVPSSPHILDIALTGVCRQWRRRGIATAIKLKSIAMAQDMKATKFKTGNEEDNPMLDINMQMGFTPAPAWLDYEKKLRSS